MENAAVANVLRGEGYRYCHTNLAEAGIYYKYYQEGFHIVMAVDLLSLIHISEPTRH